jgi:hypothetical protein
MPRTRTSDLHDRLWSLTTLAAHLLIFLAVFAMSPARADEPAKPASRAEATAIIADARKIVTPNGVERLEKVRIGGIDQWVSIRGTDRRNPVLLYIHGGPGYVSIPMSWWFNRGWEEYFTIVQWDQRAAGKTPSPHRSRHDRAHADAGEDDRRCRGDGCLGPQGVGEGQDLCLGP